MAKRSLSSTQILCFIVVLLFACLSVYGIFPFEQIERAIFILESRLCLPEKKSDQRIILVEIDDKSINVLGSWPWPRRLLAEMVDLLRIGGAKLISLNIPMIEKEPDQGIEGVIGFRERFEAQRFGKKDATTAWIQEAFSKLEESADDDQRLVETIRQHGNVILPVMSKLEKGQREVPLQHDSLISRDFLTEVGISQKFKEKISVNPLFFPFIELAQAASGLGYASVNQEESRKGVSHQLFLSYKDSLLPSLPLRTAIAYLGLQPKQVVVEKTQIKLRTHSIPIRYAEMLIKYHKGMLLFPKYSFVDLLRAREAPPLVSGNIVLIGRSFKESASFDTPLGHELSETRMAGCVLDNLLNRNVMFRASYLVYIEILVVLVMGAAASLVFPRVGQVGRLGLTLVLMALTFGAAFSLLALVDVWLKTVYITGCLVTICLIVSVGQFITTSGWAMGESAETNRALGLAFQKEGLLDLAFEKFRKLPLNEETKHILYELGLECEEKRMIGRALDVYRHIRHGGRFKDLDVRIPSLQEENGIPSALVHAPSSGNGLLEAPALEEKTRIGRYNVLGVLGKGSMGLVYKALDPRLSRLLAIKTLRFSGEFDDDVVEEIRARFFREAEISAKLSHPSIVTIHDLGEDGDLIYMAMEFLDGVDLEKYVKKDYLLPLSKVLQVVASIADALEFAHRANVIHRDIKPANIMLVRTGGVKVTDFGIAKAISSSKTKTGVILGTPNYMSPEQIMGHKIDSRSDIFSLGALFFQLLTGELPFQGDNLSSLLYEITQRRHPTVRNFNPKLPRVCDQIIDKALAKSPDERFQTAGEIAKIARFLAVKIEQVKTQRPIGKTVGEA